MIRKIKQGFIIEWNSTVLLRHTVDNPAVFLGTKKLDISMVNGEFEIDDNTIYEPQLDFQIEGNNIVFQDLTFNVTLEEDGLLHLRFSGTIQPVKIHLKADKQERIYGLGEHFTSFNLRGNVVKNWVEEHITRKQIYHKILRRLVKLPPKKWPFEDYKTYFVTPTFISSNLYFCHVETSSYGTFDFTETEKHILQFSKMPDEIVFGQHDNFLALSGMLCRYRGIIPPLPDWVYDGMIVAIQGGPKIIEQKLDLMLKKGAKINGVWSQDWCGELYTFFGKQVLWNWKASPTLYPDLVTHIENWKQKGVHFLTYINPYVNANESMFEEAEKRHFLVRNQDESIFLTKATSFDFGIVDLTNPEAYEWYKTIIKEQYLKLGIMGWMADFGEYLPVDCLLANGSGEELHNQWPDLWVQLNREVLEETNMIGKALFFNRAGYKDNVKHTTLIWNGDQHVDFSDDFGMRSAVRASLSLSLSGVGLSHSDVGGYTTVPAIKRSKELYLRWLEMSTFTPVLRSHEGNKPWVNAQFDSDEELIQATVLFSTIHAMLKPYLKFVESEYQAYGYPMIRPTLFEYTFESDQCFLLGSDLYVVPVMRRRAQKQTVTIVSDGWIHLFTNQEFHQGTYTIDAKIGTPPVFYKKDSSHKELFESITKYILSQK